MDAAEAACVADWEEDCASLFSAVVAAVARQAWRGGSVEKMGWFSVLPPET